MLKSLHDDSYDAAAAAAASDDEDDDDIVETVCWSDPICLHVYSRSPGLGVTAVLGSCILQ